MRLLALPLFAVVASTGWALRESRVPSELTGPASARVSPAPLAEPTAAPPKIASPHVGRAPPELPRVAMVRGRVVEDGEPVDEIELIFYGTAHKSEVSVITDGQGRFEATLVPDDYDLEGEGVKTRVALAPGQILDGLVLSVGSTDEPEEEVVEEAVETPRRVIRLCKVTCEEECDITE